jgi:phosphate starvation-inducible PhoH-like protein
MSEISNLNQNLSFKKIDKETINIQILNNDILMTLVGQFNQNLLELEKLTNTNIFFRGNSITIKGKNENNLKVLEAIKFLLKNLI